MNVQQAGATRSGSARRLAMGGGAMVAATGVVFGDIGTSPLYALQAVFAEHHGAVQPTPGNVLGIISLIFWSVTLVVTVKYVGLVLRADSDGEGGIIALAALASAALKRRPRWAGAAIGAGIVGAALFYGDSVITPAISVLSAVEGLTIGAPALDRWTMPIALVILVALFLVQHRGTRRIGRLFGPVMMSWLAILAILGVRGIILNPGILAALSPTQAIRFWINEPAVAFIATGAVVLSITGAEALYADLGHFGRRTISRAWLFLVYPCLTINYLGQGAELLANPAAASNPFFLLAPGWAVLPLVVLATAATVIASQAVITGAYSMTQQAMRFGLLPRTEVRHTSEHSRGQIYLPVVNTLLLVGVVALVLLFGSSEKLSTAYGLAVTGTFTITTVLLVTVARTRWRWPYAAVALLAAVLIIPEAIFLSANALKLLSGGWIPLTIAAGLIVVMTTWRVGRRRELRRRQTQEGSLRDFLRTVKPKIAHRQPGTAIFMQPDEHTAPLALRRNVSANGTMHERTVIVAVIPLSVARADPAQQCRIADEYPALNLSVVRITQGFMDDVDVPAILRLHADELRIERNPQFFLSHVILRAEDVPSMSRWRARLFVLLANNSSDPSEHFHLPVERTLTIGQRLRL